MIIGLYQLTDFQVVQSRAAADLLGASPRVISGASLIAGSGTEASLLDLIVSAAPIPNLPRPTPPAGGELPNDRPVPLVLLGSHPEEKGVYQVPDEDCNPRTLAKAFRVARTEFELRRKIRQLEGDLLTIGRRFNHDIRTPLGCIITATEDLEESLRANIVPILGVTRPIQDSTEDVFQLTQRICLLCQATALPGDLEPVDMAECFQTAADRLEHYAQEKGSRVISPRDWPAVLGRSDWLVVIWWNLLRNALQHSQAITVEAGWEQEGAETRFLVRDRGVGVPLLIRDQMFQSFSDLHLPNSIRGLGLALVRRLVELQGGHCHYEANLGGGSTFSFNLPKYRPEHSRGILPARQ